MTVTCVFPSHPPGFVLALRRGFVVKGQGHWLSGSVMAQTFSQKQLYSVNQNVSHMLMCNGLIASAKDRVNVCHGQALFKLLTTFFFFSTTVFQ